MIFMVNVGKYTSPMDGMGIHGTGLYIYLHEWVTFDGKD